MYYNLLQKLCKRYIKKIFEEIVGLVK